MRVDLMMTLGVVIPDVLELGCAAKGIIVPVAMSDPSVFCQSSRSVLRATGNVLMQMRVATADVAQIALEMLDVYGVESNDSLSSQQLHQSQREMFDTHGE